MKVKKAILQAILIVALVTTAQAVRVGVVVTFLDGTTQTECASVDENASAYEVLQNTGFSIGWSDTDDPSFGHLICNINGEGCPGDNCFCSSNYWWIYIKQGGLWHESPVGCDGGDTCWNGDWNSWDGHICAQEGQMLGFAYGPWGTPLPKPASRTFNNVCQQQQSGPSGFGGSGLFNMAMNITEEIHKNSPIEITLTDIKRNRTIKKAQVIVYGNTAGILRIYEGVTDENGYVTFSINKTGAYNIEIRAQDYHTIQQWIDIMDATTTTTTTTTTLTTTTTTTTTVGPSYGTTTTLLPHLLYKPQTTTTLEETTTKASTTIESSTTTTTIEYENKITGRAVNYDEGQNRDYTPLLGIVFLIGLSMAYLMLRR